MNNILWVLMIFVFLTTCYVSGQRVACTDFIKLSDNKGVLTGTFDVFLGDPVENSFAEVSVFVDDKCQDSLCSFRPQLSVKKTREYHVRRTPVPYKIEFRGSARDVVIKGVALRNSTRCAILCRQPNQNSHGNPRRVCNVSCCNRKRVDPQGAIENMCIANDENFMRHAFYPSGPVDARKASCSPTMVFSGRSRGFKKSLTSNNDACGVTAPSLIELSRGGSAVSRGEWPWLVALYSFSNGNEVFLCGATLIFPRVVLTAQHCVEKLRANETLLLFDRYNLRNYSEGFVQMSVEEIILHPDYRSILTNTDADIALLIVNETVEYRDNIRAACLWMGSELIDDLAGQNGTVVGWGTDETGLVSDVPKKIEATIKSDQQCILEDQQFAGRTTKRSFCAGNTDGSGPCQGDSGGALMMLINDRWMIRGIVSATFDPIDNSGIHCNTNRNAVYTDLAKFTDWIRKEIDKYMNNGTS